MGEFFGTDGIRGEYGKSLNQKLAYSVGNAITRLKKHPSVVIGHDTRISCDAILLAICAGIVQGGGNVINVGIIPTAGISYLTQKLEFDLGIMITASHNPPSYNGIKIFDKNGQKLNDKLEEKLEEYIKSESQIEICGTFKSNENLTKHYVSHLLKSTRERFKEMTICIDSSNGASYKLAPQIFKKLNANVFSTATTKNGNKININCGSLHLENLKKLTKEKNADIGFAFDGDADRVIAVNKNGEVFDGDKLLYILATNMKKENSLYANSIVGTSHTNSGIMIALNKQKINLIRTDIGDKYVIEAMNKMNLVLGGEQSGHIIIKDYAETGDGILTAIKICEILKTTNKSIDELFDVKLIPQTNIDIEVKDKLKIINNEKLKNLTTKIQNEISPSGRILIRASGTENKIRIMLEYPNQNQTKKYIEEIKKMISSI